jgi:hypothetical protein
MFKTSDYLNRTRSFLSGASGSVAVTTALVLVPVLMAVMAYIDYTRASQARAHLQNLADAGLLAVFRHAGFDTMKDDRINGEITRFVHANNKGSPQDIRLRDISSARTANEISTTVKADMPTTMLRLFGMDRLEIAVSASARIAGAPVEIALALDTTASMRHDMASLRGAAQALADIIMRNGRNSQARLALVPYAGAVNIGNSVAAEQWIDKTGTSPVENMTLKHVRFAKWNGCSYPAETMTHGGDEGNVRDGGTWLQERFRSIFGISSAHAGTPYTYWVEDGCYLRNPPVISNWQLLANIPNARWKGCVEARMEPYDVSDDPPVMSSPRSLWPIYFWPDSADFFEIQSPPGSGNTVRLSSPDPYIVNNYLADTPFISDTDLEQNSWGRTYSVLKYDNKTASFSETPPFNSGPNKACPDPIQPLTSDYGLVSARISGLNYYEGSGTNGADGVAWAWRALSPTAPFEEGAAYGEVNKFIVLLSDGSNELLRDIPLETGIPLEQQNTSPFLSHYTAYGYLRHGRFQAETFAAAAHYLDGRMLLACRNAKATGIEIFTIGFGIDNEHSRSVLRECATSPSHALDIARSGDLKAAFVSIAQRITRLHLTR